MSSLWAKVLAMSWLRLCNGSRLLDSNSKPIPRQDLQTKTGSRYVALRWRSWDFSKKYAHSVWRDLWEHGWALNEKTGMQSYDYTETSRSKRIAVLIHFSSHLGLWKWRERSYNLGTICDLSNQNYSRSAWIALLLLFLRQQQKGLFYSKKLLPSPTTLTSPSRTSLWNLECIHMQQCVAVS